MTVLTAVSPYFDINGKYELLGNYIKMENLEIYNPVEMLLVFQISCVYACYN